MGKHALNLPEIRPGARVGLLGGSFDPAHEGHLIISLRALHQVRLDWVWWLVSPQNPLKVNTPSASLSKRLEQARHIVGHPLRRIWVTDIEARLGTRYLVTCVRALQMRYNDAKFVLLMGTDNLKQLSEWRDWQMLISMVPLVVAPRDATVCESLDCEARAYFGGRIFSYDRTVLLAQTIPPVLSFLSGARIAISSTLLRNQREKILVRAGGVEPPRV